MNWPKKTPIRSELFWSTFAMFVVTVTVSQGHVWYGYLMAILYAIGWALKVVVDYYEERIEELRRCTCGWDANGSPTGCKVHHG